MKAGVENRRLVALQAPSVAEVPAEVSAAPAARLSSDPTCRRERRHAMWGGLRMQQGGIAGPGAPPLCCKDDHNANCGWEGNGKRKRAWREGVVELD